MPRSRFVPGLAFAGLVLATLPGFAQSASEWETPEYFSGGFLDPINAAEAYALGFTGKGVTVAVIDSGIDARHPEFAGKLVDGYSFYAGAPIVPGVNFDQHFHGTHVAGIVGANRDGVGMHGVAFDAAIMPVAISFAGDTETPISDGIYYAIQHGAPILSGSIGVADCEEAGLPCKITGYTPEMFNDLFGDIVAAARATVPADMLAIFANANTGDSDPSDMAGLPYLYPELADNWLAVASVDEDNVISDFSNRCGVAMDYCLAAPGEYDRSTVPLGYFAPPRSSYARFSGTSMATPVVSGVAALVKEAFPWFGAHDLQQTLLTTATDLGDPGVDEIYGWGLVNAGKAVRGYGQFTTTAILDTKGYSSTFSNDISGPGGLVKRGLGTLTLSGANSYAGTSAVLEGGLAVTGSVAGAVEVSGAGTLSGTGSVGSAQIGDGGTVAPGASIGTLVVAGNYVQQAGGTYEFEFVAVQSDHLAIAGTAALDGTLRPILLGNDFSLGQSYEVLSAAGGVTGQFAAIEPVTPFLAVTPSYGTASVDVTLARGLTFAEAAATANQAAVGAAVDLGQQGETFKAMLLLPTVEAGQSALAQLSGEAYASAETLLVEESGFLRNAVINRLRAATGGVGGSAAPAAALSGAPASDPEGPAVWATGFGAWSDLDGDGNASGLSASTGGLLMGADTGIGAGWKVGLAGGYSHSNFEIGSLAASGGSESWQLGLYGGNRWGNTGLRAGMSYAWQSVDLARVVAFPGSAAALQSSFDAGTFQAFGDLGQRFETPVAAIEPFAALAYVALGTDGFSEGAGMTALTGQGSGMDTAFTTLGLRAEREIRFQDTVLRAHGALGWRHAFGDTVPTTMASLSWTASFVSAGVPIAEDAALVEAGLDLAIAESTTLGIAYAGQFGDGTTQNSLRADFSLRF